MSEAGYWFIQSVWHDCVLKQVWKSLFCAGWLCISWFFSLLPRYRVPFLCPGHQHLVSHKTLCYWICLGTTGSNQLTKYLFPSYVLSLGGLGIQYQKNSVEFDASYPHSVHEARHQRAVLQSSIDVGSFQCHARVSPFACLDHHSNLCWACNLVQCRLYSEFQCKIQR